MPLRSVTFSIFGDGRQARAEIDWINRERDKLNKSRTVVDIEANTPQAKLASFRKELDSLRNMRTSLPIDVKDRESKAALDRLDLQLMRLNKFDAKPKVSVEGLTKAQAELSAANLGFDRVIKSSKAFGSTMENEDRRLGKMFTAGHGWGQFGLLFGGKFALFGGLAGSIGVFHLLIDAVIEVAAVLIPAALAATAFGVAAADAATKVFHHMSDLHTVMDATGKSIPPLTDKFESMQEAVKPQVYQIFGDALNIMNQRGGVFQTMAVGAGNALTHLAARMTVAITQGEGLGLFLQNAVPNLAKVGDSFGNLFGIIGNLLSVMPGYAEILLNFGDTFLRLAEYVSRVAKPIIGAGLWIHGFIVWAGLGATAAWALSKAVFALGTTAVGTAVKSFGIFIARLTALVFTEGIATASTFALDTALQVIADNPLLWIGTVIGALAGLVFWMNHSTTSAEKWGNTLQQSIDNSATVMQGLQRTQFALSATSNSLQQAQIKLAGTQKFIEIQNIRTGASTRVLSAAYRNQQGEVQGLQGQVSRFSAEMQFSIGRLNGLGKAYHGTGNAIALLNAAGITQAEWQDKTAEGWAIITAKINGTIAGYKAMGQRAGTLGNDLAVMDRGLTDQYQAMQKLNQSWDQYISDLTGTQSTFDTAIQGVQTLSTAFAKANKNGVDVSVSVGKIKDKFQLVRAPIDSLTKSGVALSQAFTEQVSNTNAMIDTWRQAGITSTMFTRGVKDSIAPLVRYARGSAEATAQLIGLAREGGAPAITSMKGLVKWLGNTHDSLRIVKHVTDQATIQESLLTGAMRGQGSYIANTLLRQLDMAELRYGKVGTAVDDYGKAIARWGTHSKQAKDAEDAMNKSIIQTMHNAGDTKLAIAEMIAKMDKIPLKKAIQIVERGLGHFTIKDAGQVMRAGGGPGIRNFHTGGKVPGFGGGDKWPALLEGGEAIVPKHLTPAVAPFLAAHGVPGFANGAILTGDKGVLTGQAPVDFDKKFTGMFTRDMEQAMFVAMKKAMFGGGAAIARLAASFATGNNHPYVWGGMSPSGWDCSGFTSFIYRHFGYNPPRTSEAQFGWGQHSPDVPGALVFFSSPAGGPPPGHVGISMGNGRMADAAGTGIGTVMGSTAGNMGFRVPPGGFRGGGGASGGTAKENQLGQLWIAAGGPPGMAHLMAAIAMAESGGRAMAHNPSGAAGLWQILGLPFPGNPYNELTNARMAVAKWRSQGLGAWEAYTNGSYRRFYGAGTEGAAPGWGWVGEHGPELVKFHGGETVLDSFTSRMVGGGVDDGYWTGTVGQAVRALRHHGYIVRKGGLPGDAHAVHPTREPWHDMVSLARAHGFSVGDQNAAAGGGSGGSGSSGGKDSGGGGLSKEQRGGLSVLREISGIDIRKTSDKTLVGIMDKMLTLIGTYTTGPRAIRRESILARQVTAMENIRDRVNANRQTISKLYADKRSIMQGLSGYGDLSGLTIGPTAGIGDNVALSGGQGLKLQLTQKIHTMRQFGNALKKLHRLGLRNSLLRQIIDMGPDQGLEYANELISGGGAFIKALSREEGQLTREERRISKGAASALDLGEWKTGKAFYQGLFAQREHLRKLFGELGRELGKEAARWFRIPRNRRIGFATGGILREPVIGWGVSGQEYSFGENGAEFFAPMHTPAHAGNWGRGGDVYNIYVSGDMDPDQAARRIISKIRDYKRRHGNQDTGIG
jgi:hypothetical protein